MSSAAQTYSVITRLVVLVLALVISGGLLLRFMLRRRQVPKAVSEKREAVGELKLDDPATHLGRAEALLTQDSREAIREGLLCLLSTLERLRFAKPNRVKTNQELAHGLSERGAPAELIASVTPLLAWFDSAFYSLEPVPSAEAKRFVDDVRRITVRDA